jgi:multisubunit Na+/H+ antiporter MnhB subunit
MKLPSMEQLEATIPAPLRNFKEEHKAVGGVIYVLIGLMIMLLVGIIVVNALINSQTPDSTWSAKANTTWASVQTNIWIAMGLVTVALIIVGAMAILSYLNMGQGKSGF